jgi:hypothetical protein
MWLIVDELIDIMLLLAETKYGYKLDEPVREEVRVVELDSGEEERRRSLEMEEHWRIQERLRVAQEERRRLEEAEMWRQRRFRARQLIVKELKSNYPAICALDWTDLNSMARPPAGVGLVTSWLYYLVYLAKDDEASEYFD